MKANKTDLVSVIVPVYNVEKYIEKCLRSLIDQTYSNIEIIVINDGSPDNSEMIIKNIQKEDKRIKLICQKNSGVSAARNAGLDIAKGKYVMFVDSDDYVAKDYVEYFYRLINYSENIDMAVDYNMYNIYSNLQVQNEKIEVASSEKVAEYIYTSKIMVAVWNKIYRNSFLKKYSLRFNKEIWYGEGMLFNMRCLGQTDKVVIGNKRVYYQVFNESSAMRSFDLDSNMCGLRSLDLQRECWKRETKSLLNAWKFHRWCFNMSIIKGIIKTDERKKYAKEFKECKSNVRKGWYYPWIVDISIPRKLYYVFSSLFPVLGAKTFLLIESRKASKHTSSRGN